MADGRRGQHSVAKRFRAGPSTHRRGALDALADGRAITRYTITNSSGAKATFIPLGAAILSVEAPDRDGTLADVVLGYDSAADYNTSNFAQIGLTIGRYANRIASTKIALDGQTFELQSGTTRDGEPAPSVMHGGPDGFGNRVWSASQIRTADGPGLRFTLVSPDGDQGFPGRVTVSVTYHWTDDYRLIVDYAATTTKPTVVKFTQHSYFNLAGAGNGDVLGHTLAIAADFFTFALPDNTPTGEIRSVRGTPFDFTVAKPIGRDIEADDPQMVQNRGYNQNFVLRRSSVSGELAEAAVLHEPASGRTLTVSTNEPGLFLYTANFIDTQRIMKGGLKYPLRAGVALETGHFPDSPNQPHFPRTTLLPDETFEAEPFSHSPPSERQVKLAALGYTQGGADERQVLDRCRCDTARSTGRHRGSDPRSELRGLVADCPTERLADQRRRLVQPPLLASARNQSRQRSQRLKGVWRVRLNGSGFGPRYSAEAQPIFFEGVLYVVDARQRCFRHRCRQLATSCGRTRRISIPASRRSAAAGPVAAWRSATASLLGPTRRQARRPDQATGEVAWSIQAERWQEGFTITTAPLYYDGLVITGFAGAEFGVRGRVKAYDADDGSLVWTFYTIPGPGELGHDTWPPDNEIGAAAERRCGRRRLSTPSSDSSISRRATPAPISTAR